VILRPAPRLILLYEAGHRSLRDSGHGASRDSHAVERCAANSIGNWRGGEGLCNFAQDLRAEGSRVEEISERENMCIYGTILFGWKKLNLVIPIVDGQGRGAEEKAAG
jgi:hypothetical protein